MLTINLDTSTPEENHNWVEFGNSLTGIKYADISVANGGIILDRISVGLQVVDPTFTVEYCPDLLSGVTVIRGKGYATKRSADKTKRQRLKQQAIAVRQSGWNPRWPTCVKTW